MANQRFFQDTGKVGGTGNPADLVFYVNTVTGDDANLGSNVSELESIQRAIDIMPAGGADIVVSGPVQEGDFTGVKTSGSVIFEGFIVIDGSTSTTFQPFNFGGGVNKDFHSGQAIRNYGIAAFENFNGNIQLGTGVVTNRGWYHNCIFLNCLSLGVGGYTSEVINNVFINSYVGSSTTGTLTGSALVNQKNTYVNSVVKYTQNQAHTLRSNYFDPTSKFDNGAGTPAFMNYNHFHGTVAGKIVVTSGTYTNVEDFKVANPTLELNGLGSAVAPLFNAVNGDDYTLQETSPLLKAGHDKAQIGAESVAYSNNDFNNPAIWTATGVDVATTPGEAVLTASPTGTLETAAVTGIQLFPKKRLVPQIDLPGFETNYGLGETIGNLASANSPYLVDLEIQYSDDGVTFNAGGWLRVPIGVQPLHDTVNGVGNDDAAFDVSTAVPISCKFMKIRITFRDNETPI